jgi:hypothetical protein
MGQFLNLATHRLSSWPSLFKKHQELVSIPAVQLACEMYLWKFWEDLLLGALIDSRIHRKTVFWPRRYCRLCRGTEVEL